MWTVNTVHTIPRMVIDIIVFDARNGQKRPKAIDIPIELPQIHFVAPDGTPIYMIQLEYKDELWFVPCVKEDVHYILRGKFKLRSHFIKWLNKNYPHSREVLR